jgi:light-regulated signal transduction histidine kinase (bacteriophytochrome)
VIELPVTFKEEKFWMRSTLVPNGEMVTSTAVNITKDKQAEEKLRQQNRDLVQVNAELEAFNRVASHDLQEPLRKIQLFISRIQQTEQPLSEKGRDYFEKIVNAVERMRSLILNLLTYSHIERGDEAFEQVDLHLVLEKAKDNLFSKIEETKAKLQYEELPNISAIPFQMEQLFSNLLSNALKYIDPKTSPNIRITSEKVHREQVPFDFYKSSKHFHKITFIDQGIGFGDEHANRIFEVFQRLHQPSEYSGTGIGLAICKKIVENHHGFILATSELGEGSAFVVYLPA